MSENRGIYLDENAFKKFWKNKEDIFKKKNRLVDRFDAIKTLIDYIVKNGNNGYANKVVIENGSVKLGETDLTIKINNEVKKHIAKMFGPAKDGLVAGERFTGITNQAKAFYGENTDNYKRVINILSLLGGFEFVNDITKTPKMFDEYRIISNAISDEDDFTKTLTSYGQSAHPSSHFADNNYFFEIMRFIQDAKSENFQLSVPDNQQVFNYNIALRHPVKDGRGAISNKDIQHGKFDTDANDEEKEQKKVLKRRFPLKFLWMWANKDKVIHPFSLMAFRNFIKSEFGKAILIGLKNDNDIKNLQIAENTNYQGAHDADLPKLVTNSDFDIFVKIWKKFTEKVKSFNNGQTPEANPPENAQPQEEENKKLISEISKLISVIMVEDTDMKNIEELLRVSKQIILYGSPGTGKTYSAMDVARKLITQNENTQAENFENEYRFINKFPLNTNQEFNNQTMDHGLYEIIQFHPSYTYYDFIGGIFPNVGDNNGSIKYELKGGIFKRFCEAAKANEKQNFVLIIDEINRSNLSEVFGELLYALEYRGKAISIPYFGEFVIPENVYIIGTMNNVDKSLVTFDLALRRRFGFYRLEPDLSVLQNELSYKNTDAFVDRCALLNRIIINKPLEENENKDFVKLTLYLSDNYQIGHAYFLKIKEYIEKEIEYINPTHLQKLWEYHLEPLLEEYLGMSLESEEIKKKLKGIKTEFIKTFTV